MKYLLGIDIGTSGTKTALFDTMGNNIASSTKQYPLYQPHNGWAEQDPEDWWRAVKESVKEVLSSCGVSATDIAGIGLSGQMHGLVMLDGNGDVLCRSIIWCDQRTGAECEELNSVIGAKRLIELTANPAMTGFTASKILWVRKNLPEIYAACRHILLPKDYIRYKLTGVYATEVSDASGMQLMDVPGRCWSDEILSKLNIDPALLAKMYESCDITGYVSEDAAKECSLAVGTPVAGGAADNAAAAVGTGITAQGRAFNTIGSSAVIYAVSDEVRIDTKGRIHTLCASVPGKWTLMSCTQGAGISLKWLRDNCCTQEAIDAAGKGIDAYDIMTAEAEKVPVGADRLIFLPYLMGERSPHPDADCRGVFFGLSAKHTRPELIRSVLEGVAFSQRECLDVFREMGVDVGTVTLCGGGSRSGLWRKIFSDVYRCNVNTLKADEGAALGAALLAGVAVGIYPSVDTAADSVVKYNKSITPDMGEADEYDRFFPVYTKLYQSLKNDFAILANA